MLTEYKGLNIRMQAQVWCTTVRARKVVISLTLLAFTAAVINWVHWRVTGVLNVDYIYDIFQMIVTVSVLVINVVVVRQVRRSAANAAANLGVQQHHQSTSSNSTVPTVMLIATSLIYVLLYGVGNIFDALFYDHLFHPLPIFSYGTWVILRKCATVLIGLCTFVYAYNFYVYLITGEQFRSELHKLFSCCLSSFSSSSSFSPPPPPRPPHPPPPASSSFSSSSSHPLPPPPLAVAAVVVNDAEVARRRGQTDTTL